MPETVRIRRQIFDELLREARRAPAAECCGLLAGRGGEIISIHPAPNALSSATAYEIAPDELFRLMKQIRAAGLELLGIYHSHPTTKNKPSARDVADAFYPETPYFILSPRDDSPRPVRAFLIRDGAFTELEIVAV